jgi:hypothetical protein
LGEIPARINKTADLNMKPQLRSLEADYVCIYLGRYSSEKSKMPKTCGWENFQVREEEGHVKDFREAVDEGVKSVHMAKKRIVWWAFCKHDKNRQLS